MSAPAAPPGTYHERQQFMRCGLHAVNNMLQRRAYSTRDFEKIAADLAAFGPESSVAHLGNPHRAVLTLGNYDANVVLVALSLAGFEAAWCVHASVDTLRDAVRRPDTLGFLVNVSKFFSRHWLAVRKLTDDGSWGFFDSNAPHPRLFGSEDEVCSFAHLLSPFFFFVFTTPSGRVWTTQLLATLSKYSAGDSGALLLRVYAPDSAGKTAVEYAQSFCGAQQKEPKPAV